MIFREGRVQGEQGELRGRREGATASTGESLGGRGEIVMLAVVWH